MKYKRLKFEEVDFQKEWIALEQPCYFCHELRKKQDMFYGCDVLFYDRNKRPLVPWAAVEEFCSESCMNLYILSRIEE